jgi:hypothetical protein
MSAEVSSPMDEDAQKHRPAPFVIGMALGAAAVIGLAAWLAPRSMSAIRNRVTDSAEALANRVGRRYQHAKGEVGDAIERLARKGQDVRESIAEAASHADEGDGVATTTARTRRAVAKPRRPTAL